MACSERAKPGGCQLHNLHCGYPACEREPMRTHYGVYCPTCHEPSIKRFRGIPAYDECDNGHRYLASMALSSGALGALEHLTAAMAADDNSPGAKNYATLRVALRNAISSVFCNRGYLPVEVSEVYRQIEAGMDQHDASRALERALSAALSTYQHAPQNVS